METALEVGLVLLLMPAELYPPGVVAASDMVSTTQVALPTRPPSPRKKSAAFRLCGSSVLVLGAAGLSAVAVLC